MPKFTDSTARILAEIPDPVVLPAGIYGASSLTFPDIADHTSKAGKPSEKVTYTIQLIEPKQVDDEEALKEFGAIPGTRMPYTFYFSTDDADERSFGITDAQHREFLKTAMGDDFDEEATVQTCMEEHIGREFDVEIAHRLVNGAPMAQIERILPPE